MMDENQNTSAGGFHGADPEDTVFFSTGAHLSGMTGDITPPSQDPLDEARELPALFPEEEPLRQTPQPATVVQRPKWKKKRTIWTVLRIAGKLILGIVLAVAVLAAGLVGYLTVTEYSPAYAEVALRGANGSGSKLSQTSLRIVTFNTGYGALGNEADFFMDGGTEVNPEDQDTVERNMIGIERILNRIEADVILLQEVDTDSDRSFHLNQFLQYEHDLMDGEYESRFATNYACRYVPYPLNERIGEVNSGIATYSRFAVSSATRYSLPCPFKWPVRVANLKRCMLVTRLPLEDSEKELVVVNFHLEAYDDGEGKEAQFRQLLEFVQAEYAKGNYVIAGGDFNQSFPGTRDTYPILDEDLWTPGLLDDLPEGWLYACDDATPTCRLLNQPYDADSNDTQYYVLDGFLVSPNVSIERVETLDEGFLYSDHNPVVMDILLLTE